MTIARRDEIVEPNTVHLDAVGARSCDPYRGAVTARVWISACAAPSRMSMPAPAGRAHADRRIVISHVGHRAAT